MEGNKNENRILTELPRHTEGTYEGKTNCQAMVGMELELLYKGSVYKVKVLEYIKGSSPRSRFVVEYNGQIHNIGCSDFINGKFGGILKLITKDFKINVGDIFKDDKRDIIITNREHRKDKRGINRKWYKYTCNKCNWTEGWITEDKLLRGYGCSCCAGKTSVLGINTIWDTDRWLCDLGVSEEDAKTHIKRSNKKVTVTCPNCGKTKDITINDIYSHKSIGCSCGGGGNSYPEKFMTSVLDQLNIEYIFQLTKKSFYWCEDKKYDFYIPSLNTIIETHGRQHYEDCTWSKAKDVQENDRIKHELALQNGIKDYIVIDCRFSNKEWIKNNILSSELNELFDLEKINWDKCEEFALSNIVKEVCEYWSRKEDWETTATLMKVFGLSKFAITNYLKKGAGLGWCEYDAKGEMRKNGLNGGKLRGKRVAMYDLNGNFIMEECSVSKLVSRVLEMGIKVSVGGVTSVCRGERNHHKGYTFKYID